MSKTLGTKTAVVTDQSISAESFYRQSTSFIDVSGVTGYVAIEFKAKYANAAATGDVILYIMPSLDGSVFPNNTEAIPVAMISAPDTTYVIETTAFDVTPFDEIGFCCENTDETYAATITISYRTSAL